jgi:predicted RNA-binding Zn ribbon-like protein
MTEWPICAICLDSMIAAEASAYLADDEISYLWTCDTCGYGFVTRHSAKSFVCN